MRYEITAVKSLNNLIKNFSEVNVGSGKNINLMISGLEHIDKYFPEIAEQFKEQYGRPISYAIKELEQDKTNIVKINNACADVVDRIKRFTEDRSSKNVDRIDNTLPNYNPKHYEGVFGNDSKLSLQTLVHFLKESKKETIDTLYETPKYWEGDHRKYMRDIEDLHNGTYSKVLRLLENISLKTFASWPYKVADGFENLSKNIVYNHKGLTTLIYYLSNLHPEFNTELEKVLGRPVKEYLNEEMKNTTINEDMLRNYKETVDKLNEETNEHIKKENITFTQNHLNALIKRYPINKNNTLEVNAKIITTYVNDIKKALTNCSEKLDTTIKSQHFSDKLNDELSEKHGEILNMGMGEIENLWNKVQGLITSSISTPNQ